MEVDINEVNRPVDIKIGQLRVNHISQISSFAFRVYVNTIKEAVFALEMLALCDRCQFDGGIKSDFRNVQRVEVFEGEDWVEWVDDYGRGIGSTNLV